MLVTERQPSQTVGGVVTTRWQAGINRPVYERAVATVGGMQDDADARYSMRRFLEQALTGHAEACEQAHHGGQSWPDSGRMRRGGAGARSTERPELVLLQTWLDRAVAGRTTATINGMKEDVDAATTLRSYVEAAITSWADALERTHHGGQPWPATDGLRQGRRPS